MKRKHRFVPVSSEKGLVTACGPGMSTVGAVAAAIYDRSRIVAHRAAIIRCLICGCERSAGNILRALVDFLVFHGIPPFYHKFIRCFGIISTHIMKSSRCGVRNLNFFESVVFLLICSESCVIREWHKFEDDFQIFPSYISVHSFVSIRRLLLGTHPSDFVRNGSFLCAYIPENGFYLSGYFFFVPGISATLRISSLLSTGR